MAVAVFPTTHLYSIRHRTRSAVSSRQHVANDLSLLQRVSAPLYVHPIRYLPPSPPPLFQNQIALKKLDKNS